MGRGASHKEPIDLTALSKPQQEALDQERLIETLREHFSTLDYWQSSAEEKQVLYEAVGGKLAEQVALFKEGWDSSSNREWCTAVLKKRFGGAEFWQADKVWKEYRYRQVAEEFTSICEIVLRHGRGEYRRPELDHHSS